MESGEWHKGSTPRFRPRLAHVFEEAGPEVDLTKYGIEDWASLALFWLMALAVFLQFFTRYVLNDSLAWTEEIATYCLVAVVFIGSAMCVRLDRHIHVDILFRYMPPGLARAVATVIDALRTPSSPMRPTSCGGSRSSRDHDDDHAAEELGLRPGVHRVRPDVHPVRSSVGRELAPGLLDPREARGLRRRADLILVPDS